MTNFSGPFPHPHPHPHPCPRPHPRPRPHTQAIGLFGAKTEALVIATELGSGASGAAASNAALLGALQVTQVALDRASQHRTEAAICTDREAVDACMAFAADHRVLVEPACGAGLAVAYSPRLRSMLQGLPSAVIEVCGGSAVTVGLLAEWDSTVA